MEWNQHSTYSKTFLIWNDFSNDSYFFYEMLWNDMEYTFHFLVVTGEIFLESTESSINCIPVAALHVRFSTEPLSFTWG